jgi:two-component system sensor histidine kinase KdpD
VSGQDGQGTGDPGALAAQRALVESLGGTYHQVVGDDIPRALAEFARSADATQLVIGASRRGRLATALAGPGVGATVVRESDDIDVHIVTHAAAGDRFLLPRMTRGALSVRRRLLGFALAIVGGPLLTWLLVSIRSEETITSDVLAYQLLVVLVSLVGGIWPAVFAAVMSALTLNYFFVQPYYTVNVAHPRNVWALILYVLIAVLVSFIVDRAARAARAARRSEAEAELLATVAGSVLRGESAVPALISRTRESLGLAGVRLVDADGTVVASDGEPVRNGRFDAVTVSRRNGGPPAMLELHGHVLDASARRLVDAVAAQLSAAMEHTDLSAPARKASVLAETDQVRSALLSAVSHDLRRPLAAAVAAVGGLRAAGANLSPDDRDELVATADESLATLSALVTDLLDVSRVEAGVLAVSLQPVDSAEVVVAAVEELGAEPERLELALDPRLPMLKADPVLLQRVLVNVLANAVRHSPSGSRVRLSTSRLGGTAEIRVIDHGTGVAADRLDDMFSPFQRLGDTDNSAGLGLGLALSRGFTEGMGGTLAPEATPGGGLTMVIALPVEDGTAPNGAGTASR